MEVLVEHDYVAKEPDELTIKKGDIIKNVVQKQGGWWEGTLNDKKGLFPDNFIKVVNNDAQVVLRNKVDVSRIRQCRVIFSYNPDHEDELNLKVGDVLSILGEEEEGWWRGVLNGKEGVFPSNFVEILPIGGKENVSSENVNGPVQKTDPKAASKVTCIVKYAYAAQNEDELNLKEGDKLILISKTVADPGWWKGELNGKVGVFPDNFVEIVSEETKVLPKPASSQSSVASQRKSLEQHPKTPPVPSKKPIISLKTSPSIIGDLKKKISDVLDGGSSSKINSTKTEVNSLNDSSSNSVESFDQVERKPLLRDVRATRAKTPGRRPTSISNLQQLKISDNDVNGIISPIENHHQDEVECRPKLREWEKHKAPWLNEMRQHQAKKTSPGLEKTTPKGKICPELDAEATSPSNNNEKPVPVEKPTESHRKTMQEPININANGKQKPTPPKNNRFSLNLQNSKDVPVVPEPVKNLPLTPSSQENNEPEITYKQYSELLDRVKKIEILLEKQQLVHAQAVEELQGKLNLEIEMRIMLQKKVEKFSELKHM